MFRGLTAVNVDEKGRVAIPSRHRAAVFEESKGNLILTIDTEQACLLLYSLSHWQAIEEKLIKLPSFNAHARRVQRLLIGHATEVDMDRQGRILLAPALREYAGIERSVMLVGQGNKFEIWSEAEWQRCREEWLQQAGNQEDLPPDLENLSL